MNVRISNTGEPFTSKKEGRREVREITFAERVKVADAVEDRKAYNNAFFCLLFEELGWSEFREVGGEPISDRPDRYSTFYLKEGGTVHYVCFDFHESSIEGDFLTYNNLTFGRFEINNWLAGILTPIPNVSFLWKFNENKKQHSYMSMYLDLFRIYWKKHRKNPNAYKRKEVLVGVGGSANLIIDMG